MTVSEIIEALTPYTGHFPSTAVQAAVAQREEVTPHLLRALEAAVEDPKKCTDQKYMLHLFATYLLAQFRDKRAYRPLIKILSSPGDGAYDLFGETITERLDNILASVYDGDPEPIKQLVEGEEVEEFVRGAAVETFLVLTHTGQITRQEVAEYFRELFRGKLHREYSQVWNALACAVSDLPAPELVGDLRKAFADDLVDYEFADLEELERDTLVPFEEKELWKQEKFTSLVSDTESEMSWWAAFAADDPPEPPVVYETPDDLAPPPLLIEPYEPGAFLDEIPSNPGIRRGPKIGRNDLCPCGSGKKYKKCCLGK